MAAKGLMEASHEEVIMECEDLATILDSEAFADSLKLLQEEGLPLDFSTQLRATVTRYTEGRIDQVNLDRTHIAESGDAQAAAEEGRDWVRYVLGRVRLLAVRRDPAANYLADRAALGDTDLGSSLATRAAMMHLLRMLETAPQAARLDISPEKVAEGRAILVRIPAEHADAVEARVGREHETVSIHLDNERLGQMLEELLLIQELVELKHKVKIPSLEVALLRSAVAPRPKKEEGDEAPPSDKDPSDDTGFR
jgi:hypothetical protein